MDLHEGLFVAIKDVLSLGEVKEKSINDGENFKEELTFLFFCQERHESFNYSFIEIFFFHLSIGDQLVFKEPQLKYFLI